ncbi:unnamed protein product [Pleuronectes platessa]|uniref:Uncharacterized protein n=1 Tax=Pleuronectes platessa TaxID=8262 RepID=A0A9N7UF12_PLEPL|nr:unnamed protein product [Pleuronectes platessa]
MCDRHVATLGFYCRAVDAKLSIDQSISQSSLSIPELSELTGCGCAAGSALGSGDLKEVGICRSQLSGGVVLVEEVREAIGEGGVSGRSDGIGGEVKLRIVCITVELEAMAVEDLSKL